MLSVKSLCEEIARRLRITNQRELLVMRAFIEARVSGDGSRPSARVLTVRDVMHHIDDEPEAEIVEMLFAGEHAGIIQKRESNTWVMTGLLMTTAERCGAKDLDNWRGSEKHPSGQHPIPVVEEREVPIAAGVRPNREDWRQAVMS